MDEYERTTTRVRTEEVIPAEPVVPVVEQPVVVQQPVVAARPMVSDRVVTEREYVANPATGLEMARRVVGLAFGILQVLLILRVILLLLIANRDNDIVQLILGVTGPFVAPFRDMFALDQVGKSTGSVLDIAALVALVGWTLVEALVFAILNLGARRSRTVVS
jgi:uncharacterized protein YggT (Ycf19 family)